MAKKQICVLGAGLAGLSAAWHLQRKGIESLVFEKESQPGGLCRSKEAGGFIFDYDGHLLHFKDSYTYRLITDSLCVPLIKHERSAWIYTSGVMSKYPFQANLYGLPAAIAGECLLGFIASQKKRKPVPSNPRNFLEWIHRTLGSGIAEHFMVPYNSKFWTVPPSELNCEWLDDFVPVPSLSDVVEGIVNRDPRSVPRLGYNSSFWYPRQGGIGQIPSAMAKSLPRVYTDSCVSHIDLKKRTIRLRSGRTIAYDYIISTVALPELLRLVPDMPARARSMLGRLRWNSIFNINLGIDRKAECGKHWIYFAQKQIPFFRVGFAHNFSPELAPRGNGSLYVEISYSRNKPLDKKKAVERSIAQLRSLKILNNKDRILCKDINDIKYGYPVYDRYHSAASEGITDFLRAHRILPAGRYGSWKYFSMENAIMDGKRAAAELMRVK